VLVVVLASFASACTGSDNSGEAAATQAQTETSSKPTPSLPDTIARVRSGVVRVNVETCDGPATGTGFLISPRHVATVEHVVDGASKITLVRSRNQLGKPKVIGVDKDRDLALLLLPKPVKGYELRFTDRAPRLGLEVVALGYPLGLPLTSTTGSVSGLNRPIKIEGITRRALIQTDAAVNHGNSGGPLLDAETGDVIGLIDLGSTEVNGIAFAVSSKVAKPLLEAWRVAPQPHPFSTCTGAAPTRVPTPSGDQPRSVGVPSPYVGHFTSVDRLQRCYATDEYVYCASGPSRVAARLVAGDAVTNESPAPDARDHGGPSMPMGAAFRTPSGSIRCDSSSRGITCVDQRTGSSFTIGDFEVIIRPAGRRGSTAYFNSIDRLQRCYVDDRYAVCTSGPSGQGASLDASTAAANYEGVQGSADRGGPALRFGQTVTNPSGTIACDSSSRGITCRSTVSGNYFVIGDHYVRVVNGGRDRRYEN
jgi:Trypsin-like peptidase domain